MMRDAFRVAGKASTTSSPAPAGRRVAHMSAHLRATTPPPTAALSTAHTRATAAPTMDPVPAPVARLADVSDNVDVLILGAGGAAYVGALMLAKAGRSVVMVDPKGTFAGSCLAHGCVPSKAVRESAVVQNLARRLDTFGLRAQGPPPVADWKAILAHKDEVQQGRYAMHAATIGASSLKLVKGMGEVVAPDRVRVVAHADSGGGSRDISFKDLVLATGSTAATLKVPGAELAVTSDAFFSLGATLPFPKRLVVIGGGYVGAEVASMMQTFGSSVTVLEFLPQLLTGFDAGVSKFLHDSLSQRVDVRLGAEVTGIARDSGSGELRVSYTQGGKKLVAEGDTVLMAVGRVPVLPKGVELLGLKTDRKGVVVVDETMRTSSPRVYAPGDVNGRSMLFHSAMRQSLVAAHNILAGPSQVADRMRFDATPMTVFTQPEVASAGLTEEAARAKFGADGIIVGRYDYKVDPRAAIYGEPQGFIKLLFDRATERCVGGHVAGIDAAQVIPVIAIAVELGLTASQLAFTTFGAHPMIVEGVNKAARGVRA